MRDEHVLTALVLVTIITEYTFGNYEVFTLY